MIPVILSLQDWCPASPLLAPANHYKDLAFSAPFLPLAQPWYLSHDLAWCCFLSIQMFFLVTVISVTVSLPTLKKRSCAQDRQFCNLCTSHLDMCWRVGLDAVGNEWKEGHNADGEKALSWDFWRLCVWLYFIVGLFKPEVLL